MPDNHSQEIGASVPRRLALSPDCFLTRCSDYPNFIPASFKIDAQGKTLYIDPFHVTGTAPADVILITHAHPDHLSPADIARIVKKETRIICPQKFVGKLSGYTPEKVKPGDVLDLGGIQCEVVPAYNRWFPAHHRWFKFVGYVLTIDSVRIYHAGDTDFIPEMKNIQNLTAALVPIGVSVLAMNPAQAAAAVNTMKPAIAVPMHYATGKQSVEKFKRLVDPGIRVENMEGDLSA